MLAIAPPLLWRLRPRHWRKPQWVLTVMPSGVLIAAKRIDEENSRC